MLATSAIPVCRGSVCGTRPRGTVQGYAKRGHMALLRRSGVPATTAAVARTRSPLVIAAASPSVPIKIQVEYRADFGQVLKIVGAGEILGDWDPKQAPAMEWQDGDIWSATLPLPSGHHEFKLVVAAADATSAIWEGGNNRSVTVPPLATTGGSSYIAECHWGNPETTMKPAGPEGIGTYDEGDTDDKTASSLVGTGTQTVGKMTIENAGEVDDDEEKEIGKMAVGKMTVEGGETGTESGTSENSTVSEVGKMTVGKMTVDQGQPDQQDNNPSSSATTAAEATATTTVGKMTIEGGISVRNDLVDSGIGAEEGSAAAAAMTPDLALAMASGDEDRLESPFAKAISSFFQNLGGVLGSKDEDDDDDENNSNQGGSSGDGGSSVRKNKPSGGSSRTTPPPGSTGASPFSLKVATAAAAAMVMMSSSATSATAAATGNLPLMVLPPPTNPKSPLIKLSTWVASLPSPFTSPAKAEDLSRDDDGTAEDNRRNSDPSAFNSATMGTNITLTGNENNNSTKTNSSDNASGSTGVKSASSNTSTTTENELNPSESKSISDADDDSSTLEEFRERLRWLNKVTADATQELDAIAPPPLKGALDSAVKAAKETDVKPALDVAKRAVGDLQEGFSGLFSAAKEFDAATASAKLKARMGRELEARKEIEAAVAAANAANAESVDGGKSGNEQQQQQGAVGSRPAPSSTAAAK